MFLIDLHCRAALATMFFALILGAWGAYNFLRGMGLSSNFLGAIVIGEVLVLAQGVLGIILVVSGQWPADGLHFLYGVVIAISWPGTYAYTGGATSRRELGIYALISFFIFGLAVRAVMTGAVAPTCLPH